MMDRAEMIALAAPPCHVCGSPVQRTEMRWMKLTGDEWVPGPAYMVCAEGHRVLLEPLT
jgi:hypothetical protein